MKCQFDRSRVRHGMTAVVCRVGFSSKYNLTKLVYYKLKRWHRQWKINLIKENNPQFIDLSENWQDAETSSA
jgi:predicted GIY-YIG superfamily endonuclease